MRVIKGSHLDQYVLAWVVAGYFADAYLQKAGLYPLQIAVVFVSLVLEHCVVGGYGPGAVRFDRHRGQDRQVVLAFLMGIVVSLDT